VKEGINAPSHDCCDGSRRSDQRVMNHRQPQQPEGMLLQSAPISDDHQQSRPQQRGEQSHYAQIPHLRRIEACPVRRILGQEQRRQHPDCGHCTVGRDLDESNVEEKRMHNLQNSLSGHRARSEKVEYGPRGREQCAGEPVLRRWSSPRFIRHSGLADTAHRTDFRVEPLFMNIGSTCVDCHTCFAGRLLLRILWVPVWNYKSCSCGGDVLAS